MTFLTSGLILTSSPEIKALHKLARSKGLLNGANDWSLYMRNASSALRKRDYKLANSLYRYAVELAPNKIQSYDGLCKAFLAENKLLESAELYRIALLKNPEKAAFVDRFAKSLRRLATGNIKQKSEYINKFGEGRLLEYAANLYLEAIGTAPEKEYLKRGLLEIKESVNIKRKEQQERGVDFQFDQSVENSMNLALVNLMPKEKNKQDLSNLSEGQLIESIDKIDTGNRRLLFLKEDKDNRLYCINNHKKKIIRELISRKTTNNDWDGAIKFANQIAELDMNDSINYSLLKRLYRKTNNYSKLVEISRDKTIQKKTFWNQIGLAKQLIIYYYRVDNNSKFIDEAEEILNLLLKLYGDLNNEQIMAVYGGLVKCYHSRQQYEKGLDTYIEVTKRLSEPSEHLCNTLMIGVAKNRTKAKNTVDGINTLMFFSGEIQSEDVKLKKIKERVNGLNLNSTKSISAQHFMAHLYHVKGDKVKAKYNYDKILQLQPKDKIAQRKIKNL